MLFILLFIHKTLIRVCQSQKYERDRSINEEQKQEMLASLIEFQRKQGKPSSSLSERNN
jgi:hypothetical protein